MLQILYIVFGLIIIMATVSLVTNFFKRRINIFGLIIGVLFLAVIAYCFYRIVSIYRELLLHYFQMK